MKVTPRSHIIGGRRLSKGTSRSQTSPSAWPPDAVLPSAWLAGVLLVALMTASCGGGSQGHGSDLAEAAAGSAGGPFEVVLSTAERASFEAMGSATGSLRALNRSTPGTKIFGRVEVAPVTEGQAVRSGQLLARLESRDLQAAIRQAEAAVTMAEAQLENATVHHQRMVDLHGRGSVTDKNLEDATARFRTAAAEVDGALANLEAARVSLEHTDIRSPIDGWVIAKYLHAGDMASPGAPAFEIEDLRTLEVSAEVSESQLAEVSVGDALNVSVAGRQIDTEVLLMVPSGDRRSRTFTLKAELDNPDGDLRPGMFARVAWRLEATQELGDAAPVLIDAAAVVRNGQLEGVYVADDGHLELRWIKTGGRLEDRPGAARIRVLSGLEPGEAYVLSPSAELFDGAPYRAVTAPPPAVGSGAAEEAAS